MAKFKILRGLRANLPTINDGNCYFTTDEGRLYFDVENARIALNADKADKDGEGNVIAEEYLKVENPIAVGDFKLSGNVYVGYDEEDISSGEKVITESALEPLLQRIELLENFLANQFDDYPGSGQDSLLSTLTVPVAEDHRV